MNRNRVQRALEVRNHPEPRFELTAAATGDEWLRPSRGLNFLKLPHLAVGRMPTGARNGRVDTPQSALRGSHDLRVSNLLFGLG